MKVRYIFGFAVIVYVISIILALMGQGILANEVAAAASVVMLPCVLIGSRHMIDRAPTESNRLFILKWRKIVAGWTIFAIIVHVGAALFADPQSAMVWEIIPTTALLGLTLFILSDPG